MTQSQQQPSGWLDIHGHFSPPRSAEEQAAPVAGMRDLCFLTSCMENFSAERILPYLDRAGIAMQMLSYLPATTPALQASNDYLASIVRTHPSRFGMLAALPTDDIDAALGEVKRWTSGNNEQGSIAADGFAVSTVRNGVRLSDDSTRPLWSDLDARRAVVFVHPDATAPPSLGRTVALLEVAFDTARTAVDMLYRGIFRDYPGITWVFAHAGGALPVMAGRLKLLGSEPWVPNPRGLSKEEITSTLGRLWVDTAASADTALEPAVKMVGTGQCVYGSDCNVPCSTEKTMEENRGAVMRVAEESGVDKAYIGMNGWKLFPRAKERAMMKN